MGWMELSFDLGLSLGLIKMEVIRTEHLANSGKKDPSETWLEFLLPGYS